MYKVMIIDDEVIVRQGIYNIIDWEEEGFFICAEGKDGRDGLQKVLSMKPDVVLVDIKMPGLSGIELIRMAKEQGFEGHFIILTGYSEFEFAKSAVSLGVKEYLLKPIDEDELIEGIRKIRRELEEKEGEIAYHTTNEKMAREELLRRILLKLDSKEALEQKMKLYKMDFSNQILCAAIVSDKDLIPGKENRIFQEKADELLRIGSLYTDKILMDTGIVLVNGGIDYRTWADLLGKRNEWIQKKYGSGLCIAVGHNVSKWYDVAHSYEFAKFLMQNEFLFSQQKVLSIDVMEDHQYMAENPSMEYICMLIEVGDMDGIRECVNRFRQYCIREMKRELDIKIQTMYNLMQIKNWAEKKYNSGQELNIAELMEQLNQVENLHMLIELYCKILQDLCIQVGCSGSDTVIKRMYYYMEKNYDKDLKLETFARMFHYNSNYLGKIFRKEIGDSFNNILDTIRITNAKRLLAETDLKVYQISEQVGYGNIDYFYVKFKKYVGVSPKEYKKDHE